VCVGVWVNRAGGLDEAGAGEKRPGFISVQYLISRLPLCRTALLCAQGRWLMWGWLQERRKMGSYNYAGCLTLPRVLHCTEDGRLVQVGGLGGWVEWDMWDVSEGRQRAPLLRPCSPACLPACS
jgi:hypothetical protein